MILVYLSLGILTIYTIAVLMKSGIPSSISSTYYSLRHPHWFGVSMILAAFLVMPAILEMTSESDQYKAFLSCIGMIMVGAAPNFKSEDKVVHTLGAFLVLIFSQLWVISTDPIMMTLWIPCVIYFIAGTCKKWDGSLLSSLDSLNPVFWIEMTCLITTYGTLLK